MEKPKEEPKKELTPQNFEKAYKKLCNKMKYRIGVIPVWISRDDGTFSLVLQPKIEKV